MIIGGGIGGLSLARELTLRGMRPTVLERAPQLNPVGAGIIMNPNAMRVLEKNGLAEEVRRDSWPYFTRETRDETGRLLATRDYRPLYDSGKLAQGALVHRAHLLGTLYNSLPPGTVTFGSLIKNAQALNADLVVGADGINSQVRRELFVEPGKEIRVRYMGYRSHRLIMDNVAGVRCFTEYLGRGQRIGLVPISEKKLYLWTTFNSPQHERPVPDLPRMFSRFTHEPVRTLLSRLPPPQSIITTEIEEVWAPNWSAPKAVLLGDAAHAMTPNIGQGAGMAMEDARVLAEELAGGAATERALANYERRRKDRVADVVLISRSVGEDGQRTNPIACWLRNRRVMREGRDVEGRLEELERLLAYSG